MEYTKEAREQLYKKFLSGWSRRHFLMSKGTKDLIEAIEKMNDYHADRTFLREARQRYEESGKPSLSSFFRQEYKGLVQALVDKRYQEDFYTILDKKNQFPYASGINRRTVRSKEYAPFIEDGFQLAKDYRTLEFFGGSLEKYLKNELSEELRDIKQNGGYWLRGTRIEQLDDMVAARLDAGDRAVIQLVKDMLFAENNTAILTVDIIRGIVKSSNRELHQLLTNFLVAARLQEGVRQAVCENADCGTVEAFLTIFDTICEKDLIRFAAVKRAVATWTGLGGSEDADRISAKVLADIRAGVDDVSQAYEFTKSNDSIHIMVGLWSLGFRNVEDAITVMRRYLEDGTKNQILTMSCYNRQLEQSYFKKMVARELVLRFADEGEFEYIAAFFNDYLDSVVPAVQEIVSYRWDGSGNRPGNYYRIPVTNHFKGAEEAREHFECLRKLYEAMPKKQLEFSPCVFPWYSVSLSKGELLRGMACIAYMLKETELVYYVAGQLEFAETGGFLSRRTLMKLMLHDRLEDEATDILIALLGDRESFTRSSAYELLEKRSLTSTQYEALEELLRFKSNDIRKNVMNLLLGQREPALAESVKRLLKHPKEEMREGGLSLVLAAKKEKKDTLLVQEVKRLAAEERELFSEKDWVLIAEITGEARAEEILNAKGYGLYDPDKQVSYSTGECDTVFLKNYFSVTAKQITAVVEKLKKLIEENGQLEYKTAFGETRLLDNNFHTITHDRELPLSEQYPFKELWMEFYEKEIKSPDLLNVLILATQPRRGGRPERMLSAERQLLGGAVEYNETYVPHKKQFGSDYIVTIFQILQSIYGTGELRRVAVETAKYLIKELPEGKRWFTVKETISIWHREQEEKQSIARDYPLVYLLKTLRTWKNEDEFQENFCLLFELDKAFDFNGVAREQRRKNVYSYRAENENYLVLFDYVKAENLGLLSDNMLYKAVFETYGLKYSFQELGRIYKEKLSPYDKNCLRGYVSEEELEQEHLNPETPFYRTIERIYKNVVDCILDVELKRGEFATIFSESIVKIERFFGMERLVQILVAFGKEKLNRSHYYGYGSKEVSRQESFSHLIKVCYPLPGDTAEKLCQLLKKNKVSEQRLIEVAMYAPQWLDICEEYLGYPGFKTGCYYFMAHMNEHFDDKKKAVIAKYTPLTVEELNQGAFDVNWFDESYRMLGEQVFNKLYDAAKYSSDGGKHTRARKYADAALGRVTCEELEQAISDKRNKDLLMSYGLVPFVSKKELVQRYEFIKRFEKDSRQFGAQRRASESAAAQMALRNLSTKAGYSDMTRLTLAMETELVKTYEEFFEWQPVGEVQVKLAVNETGQAEVLCEKGGKALKSIPASLKKEDVVVKLREVHKKLKEQYSRTVKLFENAMETYEVFLAEELHHLCENPVTAPIVRCLVFVTADGTGMGFLSANIPLTGESSITESAELFLEAEESQSSVIILRDAAGQEIELTQNTELRVAHAYDLYAAGQWSEYQAYFHRMAQEGKAHKQPFRQVFRELYVKLPEEADQFASRMFAGHQIQPQKTVACLKGRSWVADYEDGLQKIFYKQNIIARIYALADWFSPSDIEAPTLEWVEFSERKTFKSIAIKDVPDIVYSEVMRDVDLAVSVAHAGGVDPETSHSTIEMRSVIIAFNLPLFKLNNVQLSGTHAIITGTLAKYSVHLGSGVIHQLGGPQINVLPIHSQSRGRIFLPFIDEDPKTAEILSKIVLFAKDEKIKDPYILNQLKLEMAKENGDGDKVV